MWISFFALFVKELLKNTAFFTKNYNKSAKTIMHTLFIIMNGDFYVFSQN